LLINADAPAAHTMKIARSKTIDKNAISTCFKISAFILRLLSAAIADDCAGLSRLSPLASIPLNGFSVLLCNVLLAVEVGAHPSTLSGWYQARAVLVLQGSMGFEPIQSRQSGTFPLGRAQCGTQTSTPHNARLSGLSRPATIRFFSGGFYPPEAYVTWRFLSNANPFAFEKELFRNVRLPH
jgi:hypothetical protein